MTEDIGSGYASGLLTGMTHGVGSGVDAGTLALMNSNGGLGGNNSWLVLFFLLILGGGRGFGNWGNAVADNLAKETTVVNEANYGRLMDALSAQGIRQENAVQGLAQSFNCKSSDILMALAGVDKQIALSNGDIKSAVQNVGTEIVHVEGSIKSAIQSCCCNIGRSIDQATAHTDLEMVKGFGDIKSTIQAQTNAMNLNASAQNMLLQQQTQHILDRMSQYQIETNANFCAIKSREDQRQIADLQQKLAEAKATANTQAILSAIANKDTVAVSGSLNTTAGTWAGTGSLS